MRAQNTPLFNTHLLPSGLYRWSRSFTGSADTKPYPVADYNRQWGISPRPEDIWF